ncbi:DUF397 domain-containing protein [Actinokineospora auranticolor]|uniref:Uncharacterized protein DUF397 n=1 Tax=Actinokineospora auranticolor TaxID=155976 RepID=A0A2S6GYE2_9PSEU|nr:DUF397 domain-containing protein [Actinokineospora auranticolor]PPK70181.1 uncharacterized protein DUF397 [Actinokineospora auranticolor]
MSYAPRDTGWFKSSFSGGADDNCVEVRFAEGEPVAVRDSKNPGATLSFSPNAWALAVSLGQ